MDGAVLRPRFPQKSLSLCTTRTRGMHLPMSIPWPPPGFMVFNTSGIHAINIDYCNCPSDDLTDRRTQLLRQGWFPATFSRTNTTFTFDCLNTFHEHTLQGKGNLYDFYHVLSQKTDNVNVSDMLVSDLLSLCYLTQAN